MVELTQLDGRHNMPVNYAIYFWQEDREPGLADDSILDRLSEDANLPGVDRISLALTEAAFRRAFPDISVVGRELNWRSTEGSFRVSFVFDEHEQPMIIRIGSSESLSDEIFSRVLAAAREAGCTLIQSGVEQSF